MEIERDKITKLLNERLESHDDSRKAAQDKLSDIFYGMRKQIDDFENNVNCEIEKVFQDEDKRLQDALHNINEAVSLEKSTKAVQKAKAELLIMQTYELIQDNIIDENNSNNDENDNEDNNDDLNEPLTKRIKNISLMNFTKMYKLKTERKFTSLKIIDFEERKPSIIISELTSNGKLSISFSFFDDDEINVFKKFNSHFEVTIKIWEKNDNEDNAKIITKKYVLGEQHICIFELFKPNTNYCVKIRIEHPEDGLFSQLSDESEFKIPEFNDFCVWKECPDYVDEDNKYSIDENNPRIATKVNNEDYCTIIGNASLPPNKVTSWNIKILKSKNNNGGGIYIGVAPFDINQNEHYNYYKCGWYFDCWDSALHSGPPHDYKSKEYGSRKSWGEYVHIGDTVGVVMDTTKGVLSFVLDGVNFGVAYEGIPLDKPLVPCVLLNNKDDSVELDPSEVNENVSKDSSIPVPSNIRIKSITWDSITLTWDVVDGASFYQIETNGDKSWNNFTTNTFTKRGLLPNAEHSFRVRTVKDNSVSMWSDLVKGRTVKIPEFSKCIWRECPDSANEEMKYSIDENNPRVATMTGNYFTTIIGNSPLPPNRVTSWSIKILHSRENDGRTIYVGVAPFDINQNVTNYNRCGWYFSCWNSTLCSGPPYYYEGKEYGSRKKVGEYVHKGDIVGVVMNTTKSELSFSLNDVNLGVAYKGIPLDKPFVPCVVLGNKDDSVEFDTSEVKENVDNSIPIPSNIISRSDTWDSITLSWDAVEGASFYQIEVDESKTWDASTTNTFTKRGLFPETEHTFRVRTVKDNSVGKWSDIVKGRTIKAPDFSECTWKKCPQFVDRNRRYLVDGNNPRIATMINDDEYDCTVIGNTSLPPNKVTSWNIKILKSHNNGYGIYIGVAPFDLNQGENENYEKCGWYFDCYNSSLYSGPPHYYEDKEYGPRKREGEYVHKGSIIGVVMDTTKGELSFALDGVNCGVGFEGIPLDKPLVPCVILENKGSSVGLVI